MKSVRSFRRLWDANRGAVAVEFAFIAPILILILFAVIVFSDAFQSRAKTSQMAATVADLAAQRAELTDADIQDIFQAGATVMYPYSPMKARVVVSSVIENAEGRRIVEWSDASSGNSVPAGTEVAIPEKILQPGASVLMAEVSYEYVTPVTQLISGPISMTAKSFSVPRTAAHVGRVRQN